MGFSNWLNTFLEEKGIDLEATFEFDNQNGFNIMPYGMVTDMMHRAEPQLQYLCKCTLVKIDFENGDVYHFLRGLGEAVASAN